MRKKYHSRSYLFISLLALGTIFLFFQTPVLAQSEDYQSVVQRNLEIRTKLRDLQGQYENLENERQVLIQHIKKLQQEKEALRNELARPVQDPEIIRNLRNRVTELEGRLDALAKERNEYKQDLATCKSKIVPPGDQTQELKDKIASLKREMKILKGEKTKYLDQIRFAQKNVDQQKDVLDKKIQEVAVEKEKAGQTLDQAIEDEKARLKAENEKLKSELKEKEKKLDEAIAYVENEKASFKKELRDVLDNVTISEDNLQKLKNRALKSEAESRLLKQRLMEQAQLRAKLEEDILRLRKEKVQVKADAQEYINEELDQKVAEIVRQEKDKTKEKIKEIEQAADKEMKEALAMKEQMAQKHIKEYKEETEQALKKAVAIERKMTDEKLRQFKENSRKEKVNMHYNLAVVYDKTGNYKNAEGEYLNVLALDPEDAETCYNLGILYDDKLNDNEKAIEYYKKYLELRPIGEDSAKVRRWMLHAEEEARLGPELR